MKTAIIFVLAVICVVAYCEKYTTSYDNIDLDEILKNDRLLNNYVNCLLNKGKCSADALQLKKSLPDALATECSKCSEKQKEGSRKVLPFLIKNKQEIWKELENMYDPSEDYKNKYCETAKKEGIDTLGAC